MDESESQLQELKDNFYAISLKAHTMTTEEALEMERQIETMLKPFQETLLIAVEKISKVRELLNWIGGAVAFNTKPEILRAGLLDLAPELHITFGEAKAAFQRMQDVIGIQFSPPSEDKEDVELLVAQTISGIEALVNGHDNGNILRRVTSRNYLAAKPLQARQLLSRGGRPKGWNPARLEVAQLALVLWAKTRNPPWIEVYNSLLSELEALPQRSPLQDKMLVYLRNGPYENRGGKLRKIIHDFKKLSDPQL